MKSKKTFYITSSLLAVSLLVTAVTVTKLSENQSTAGPPVSAANLKKPTPTSNIQNSLEAVLPEFPIYPNARLADSRKEDRGESGLFYSSTWRVSGDNVISEMGNWYVSELENLGWVKVDEGGDGELSKTLNFTNVNQSLMVSIVKGDAASRYRINVIADILVR